MNFETWIFFCITDALLCFTPGPGVLLIVSLTLDNQRRVGSSAIVGILVANLAYFILAAIGLTSLMAASSEIFLCIKYLGAGYLIWLGYNFIRASNKIDPLQEDRPKSSSKAAFWRGFLIHGSNPKVLLFFSAILPQFLDLETGFELQLTILGASALVIQAIILFSYLVMTEKSKVFLGTRLRNSVQNIGGVFLIAVGASLAFIDEDLNG